jgi:hypothetical protein
MNCHDAGRIWTALALNQFMKAGRHDGTAMGS